MCCQLLMKCLDRLGNQSREHAEWVVVQEEEENEEEVEEGRKLEAYKSIFRRTREEEQNVGNKR